MFVAVKNRFPLAWYASRKFCDQQELSTHNLWLIEWYFAQILLGKKQQAKRSSQIRWGGFLPHDFCRSASKFRDFWSHSTEIFSDTQIQILVNEGIVLTVQPVFQSELKNKWKTQAPSIFEQERNIKLITKK